MNPDLFNVDLKLRRKVLKSFDRTEESANEDVNTVKEWLKTQPHLPEIMEDAKIRNFLLLNKHSIENTKQKIDMYYTIRSLLPELFENVNPKCLDGFMDTAYCCVHPKLVDELYRVYFLKVKKPNTFSPREIAMQSCNISEIRLYEDCMVGEIIVFDMTNISGTDFAKLTPSLLMKLLGLYKNVYSLRIRAVYVINSPSFFVTIMPVLRKILKPKIFERIEICQNSEILNKIFAQADLPKDYGGEGPSLEDLNKLIIKKFAQYQNRFDQLDVLKVNENLRPQKLDNDDVLGFYGNFKKLNVD